MSGKETKTVTLEELKKHKDGRSCWICIHNKVYDVTKFLEEHPGGEEVLLEQAGKYGTEAFEDVGHSGDARELMQDYLIGDIAEADQEKTKIAEKTNPYLTEQNQSSWTGWLIPLGIAFIAAVVYRYVISPAS